MIRPELVSALTEARKRLPSSVWRAISSEFGASAEYPDHISVERATAKITSPDVAWILKSAFREAAGSSTWNEIAAVMSTVDHFADGVRPLVEVIWTGPTTTRLPMRRIDQVLYDLISTARERILLVTFAAHRVPHLCKHLSAAVARGVSLTLIVESEEESEGQLTVDALAAFATIPLQRRRIYHWPASRRERNHNGRPGKLHVKCAVVDDVAIVGSANFTDDAFNRNMELGVIIRGNGCAAAIVDHFEQLIRDAVLVEV